MTGASRTVRVGDVLLGGSHPVRVQTMWKSPLEDDLDETVRRIELLARCGCEIIRFAVPDLDACERLERLAARVSLPVVADIHFDHSIALRALDFVDKVRINPGNIGASWKVREVLSKAHDRGVPVRVGINAGSLPRRFRSERDPVKAMLGAAEAEIAPLEAAGFHDAVFSLKSSDINTTVHANRLFAERYDFPLHLGLTEAGPLIPGLVKSSIALGRLLDDGVGSTIRVSLSGPCEDEVYAALEILAACGRSRGGVRVVSCPKCARSSFDVHGFLDRTLPWLREIRADLSVAVMGCVVNGPAEARHADCGITGAGRRVILFRNGEIVHRVDLEDAERAFRDLVGESLVGKL